MRQYRSLKDTYQDCILFFRLGDFYEMFGEDAIAGSRLLNLTLTQRNGTPMCGVPYHAAENYLSKLTRAGKKVAICEQLTDPSSAGIVERGVVRVVTPGTTFDDRLLDTKSNHFIVAVVMPVVADGSIGFACADVTTGLLHVASLKNEESVREELLRLRPAECIVDAVLKEVPACLQNYESMPVFPHKLWDEPSDFLARFYGVKDMTGFGIAQMPEVIEAAALLVSYLKETQKSELTHLRPPVLRTHAGEMYLDQTALQNLELVAGMREGGREGSLLSVIDATTTAVGGRMLKSWLLHPSTRHEVIEGRLDAVSELHATPAVMGELPTVLTHVLDIERLLGRLSVGTGNARDMLGIGHSLAALEASKKLLVEIKTPLLKECYERLQKLGMLEVLRQKILTALVDEPPLSVREGGMIREGFSTELDTLRGIARDGKSFVQKLQEEEIQRTGITSLKVKFNTVFGYYIEITNSHLHKVPPNYTRKQTLVNAERFITPELKEFEEKILGAEGQIHDLEYELFVALRDEVKRHTRELQEAAEIFATLDVILSLALVAQRHNYVRPTLVAPGEALIIKDGRHPVVEFLSPGNFVPNDLQLGSSLNEEVVTDASQKSARVLLITGPNMGGKSTYLRQTALIVLMAHVGSFVPARAAQIPITDRIFTRVGASDNLVRGQSTFMVEMQEAAQILTNATPHSLIILDEIGRGTSTYDGLSLAWAILDHIHTHIGARALFATHYHELISVAENLSHAANYAVSVKEEKGGIVFLYRIVKGAVDRSYGIEVARLAGLPQAVLAKAKSILVDLEEGVIDEAVEKRARSEKLPENQLSIFNERPHRVLDELKNVDINQLTPLDALKKLDELKKIVD